jgi:hypothetical protein
MTIRRNQHNPILLNFTFMELSGMRVGRRQAMSHLIDGILKIPRGTSFFVSGFLCGDQGMKSILLKRIL